MTWLKQEKTIWIFFFLGAGLRILLFAFMSASGPDPHAEVLRFMVETHRIPQAYENYDGAHPPLYYLVSLPFFLLDQSKYLKITQIPALLMGLLNLWLLAKLLLLVSSNALHRNLAYGLLAVCTPPFVNFSALISNDSLAFLMGTLVFYVLYLYANTPRRSYELLLGVAVGLAVSTKFTLLPFVPVVGLFIVLVRWKQAEPWPEWVIATLSFALLVGVFGGYKLAQNLHYKHRLLIHVIDNYPLFMQHNFYQGWKSLVNFNLPELMVHPIIDDVHTSRHSIPQMLYATLWYKHIYFENNLFFGNFTRFRYIAMPIYALALAPTFALLAGAMAWSGHLLRRVVPAWRGEPLEFQLTLWQGCVLGLTLLGVTSIFATSIHYDAWSFAHARLFGHYWLGVLLCAVWGLDWAKSRLPWLANLLYACFISLTALYVVYYLTEIGVRAWLWYQTGQWDSDPVVELDAELYRAGY